MPVRITTSGITGKTFFGALKRLSDGFLWSVAATAWEAAPTEANQKIALTEGTGKLLKSYAAEVSGLGDAGAVRLTIHDDADANDAVYAGPTDFYVVGGEELPLPVNAIQWAGTATVASDYATAANQTTILNRIGAFAGTGLNTILGFFRALLRKDAALTPSDVGGAFDNTMDSAEAIRDRGDAAWTTATGFSTHSAADVWAVGTRTLTAFGFSVTVAATGLDAVLIDGKTLPAALQIIAATTAGKISGAGTGTEIFVGLDGTIVRATVQVDNLGNRTSVTYN